MRPQKKRDAPNNGHSVLLREFAPREQTLKQLAPNRQLERQIILGPGLEPFVEFHNVWVVQTLEHLHLAPHASFVPLDLLFRYHLERYQFCCHAHLSGELVRVGIFVGTLIRSGCASAVLSDGYLFWRHMPCCFLMIEGV